MDPITVWRGQVIDGRHRYAACAEAGVERRFEYLGDDADPLRYILARNDLRRHLDESRRAVVAHKLSASSAPGRPRKENGANLHRSFTQREAAELLRVSRRTVAHAARVLSEDGPAAPAVRRAVGSRAGSTVSDASRVIDEPAEVQLRALERVIGGGSKNLAGAARRVNDEASRQEDAAALESNRARPMAVTMTLHHSAVAGLERLVAEASVDAIVTNPPNSPGSLPLFLRPGGFCRPRPQAGRGDGGAGQRHASARDNRTIWTTPRAWSGWRSSTTGTAVRRSAQAIRTGSACAASPCSSTGSRDFGSKGAMT